MPASAAERGAFAVAPLELEQQQKDRCLKRPKLDTTSDSTHQSQHSHSTVTSTVTAQSQHTILAAKHGARRFMSSGVEL